MANLNQWAVDILNDNMDGYSFEEQIQYLQDVTRHGCASGCVSGVIYYHETDELFQENFKDILFEIEEYEDNTGYNYLAEKKATDIPNWSVWFVVELVANQMYNDLQELGIVEEM